MGILDFLRLKRQDTPAQYMDASLSVLDKSGRPKQPPFNYSAAVRMYCSWVYAAATLNAQAVAANPLRLYVRSRPGRKLYETRPVPRSRKAYLCGDTTHKPSHRVMRKAMAGDFEEVATDHPVLEVLRKANSIDDGFGLATTRILFLELTGNAYLHPVFDSALDIPVELWTMPSHRVKILPTVEGLVGGYRYGIDTQAEVDFAPDEVIHFKRPNPRSLLYGLGKVEAAWSVIQQSEAMHEMDYSFYENMARPDYAIIVKGGAGREQLDRFETKVREALQGTRKSGKFMAISGDVEMQPLSFPPKDLMGREDVVEEIAAIFGVPVSMLKANDPNLAAAKSGYAQWRETTIAPICRLDEETLNAKLLPLFNLEDDCYLAYDNPVPADRQQDLVERQTSVAGGWMTPNEARLEAGYDPMPDPAADRLYLGGQPLGASAQPPSPFGGLFGAQGGAQSRPSLPAPSVEPQDEEPATEPVQASKGYESKPLDQGGEDCVSNNIRTLMGEGYRREQAIAIAISVCEGKAWSEADPAKALADVDTKPTEEMADLANRGLALREEYGRGGTAVGVARARDIGNRANLSPETVRRMHAYFSRHRVDLDAEGAKPGQDGYPSAGAIAWMLWGGDPSNPDGAGAGWAARKVDELDAASEKRAERRIAKAATDYAAEIDRSLHDADAVQMQRLMEAVEKGYIKSLTDDEMMMYALQVLQPDTRDTNAK
jgi:HK97 family phage portal protein